MILSQDHDQSPFQLRHLAASVGPKSSIFTTDLSSTAFNRTGSCWRHKVQNCRISRYAVNIHQSLPKKVKEILDTFPFCTSIRSTNVQSLLSSFRTINSYDRLHSLFLSVWLQGTTNESPNWMSTCLKVSDPCQGIGQHWKPCIAMRVPYFQRLP